MFERKTEVVNLRVSPRVKELLRLAAGHERRTLSNTLEVLIEDYCKEHGLESAGDVPMQHKPQGEVLTPQARQPNSKAIRPVPSSARTRE